MLPKQSSDHFILSCSPHAHASGGVGTIMLDVIIALMPASCCSIYYFGMRALWLLLVCVGTCVFTEAVCRYLMKRESSVGDFSAVLTGLLLALNLPPDLPLWMAVVGSVFAIAIAKQVFGGLGYNPFNPALSARAFMLISFTGAMTTWSSSRWMGYFDPEGIEAVTSATPLAFIKKGAIDLTASGHGFMADLFIGNVNGCIGEVSALALIAGGIYLLARKVISWHIPVSFIGAVALFAFFRYGANVGAIKAAEIHVLCGGVIIGAIFMATDYVTSPVTAKGKVIFGLGCGLLTMLIRSAPDGVYPEGVSFSILIMNAFAPLINRFTQPKSFGKMK